jgi:hypothetical protein
MSQTYLATIQARDTTIEAITAEGYSAVASLRQLLDEAANANIASATVSATTIASLQRSLSQTTADCTASTTTLAALCDDLNVSNADELRGGIAALKTQLGAAAADTAVLKNLQEQNDDL